MGVRRAALVVVAALLLLTACRVDATTRVIVADDGSGSVAVEVVLDAEALARVPDLAEQLRVADLQSVGWEITGPEPTDDGGSRVVASKPFSDPDAAAVVLGEITGPDGPLRGAVVERSKQFGRVEQGFEATLDLSGGVEAFGDDALTELLNGLPIGQDVATLEEELGAPLAELTSFTVEVELPDGEVSSAGGPEISEGEGPKVFHWESALGDPARDLQAQTRRIDWLVLGLAALAAVVGLILVVLLFRRARKRRRPLMVATQS